MTKFIEHNYRDGESFVSWSLLDAGGQPVPVGAVLTSDHRTFKASGGMPPKHEASTGRIYGEWLDTETGGEYFPHVFDCRWLRVDKALDLPEPVAVAPVVAPLAPADVLAGALGDMVRELLAVHVPALVETTINQLTESGHFRDMANDGDFNDAIDEAIDAKLDEGEYISAHNFDLSDHFDIDDYGDEIREASSVDIKSDIESVIRDMLSDNALVIRLDR